MMPSRCCASLFLFVGCPTFVFCASCAAAGANDAGQLVVGHRDVYCGPRSVDFVLRWYNKQSDLIDIIREVQWPNAEAGASLLALEEAIESRGLYTRAIRLKKGARLRGRDPAIVFIPGAAGAEGHYVVWLPASTRSRVEFWAGRSGRLHMGSDSFWSGAEQCVVLLTSPQPIVNPEEKIVDASSETALYVGAWLAAILLLTSLISTCEGCWGILKSVSCCINSTRGERT